MNQMRGGETKNNHSPGEDIIFHFLPGARSQHLLLTDVMHA